MGRQATVNTMDELKSYLHGIWGDTIKYNTLKCRYYCYDSRIDWNTYLVTADFSDGSYKQQAVAFTDSPLDSLEGA